MKIQDFNQTTTYQTPQKALEIITATLAFLLPAILLFLIAAK